jgi:DNA-binding NarL/FixJ family response regulator
MSSPSLPARIAVALIEDNRLVREGITALLSRSGDIEVVAGLETDDVALLRHVTPDVVLLDIGLDRVDSLRVVTHLRDEFPLTRVIAMDLLPVHEEIVEFVNAGVAGFIMKDATLEDLLHTIRVVASGASVLPTAMVTTLFSQIAREAIAQSPAKVYEAVRLTPREREVINLIAEGLSNKEIAVRMHIATHTVKSHVRNVMEKLALHTRLQIAAYAHGESPA